MSEGPQQTTALALRNVEKSFPGVRALKNVNIDIRPNEVVGLIGENGAGKSTLMRILAGAYQPDAGEILINGQPVRLTSATDAMKRGIGMVYQEQSLLLNLSIGENLYLGNESRFIRFGLMRWGKLYEAARRQLRKVKVDVDPRMRAGELSFATRQMVELAKALALEESSPNQLVILLDEPTSVLERSDIDILFERVRALKGQASFVFVSHRLDEVLELSDRVYVMKDGAVVAQLPTSEADLPTLHRLMVGRNLQAEYYREPQQRNFRKDIVLSVHELTLEGAYYNVDFDLHAGEILGISGVIGSGREELTRTIGGLAPHHSGRILIRGQEVRFETPADAVDQGIGYLPRDRRTEGLVLFLSVAANITLPSLANLERFGLIDAQEERRQSLYWVDRLGVRTPSLDALCLNLSGGNQQKVVLAKWLNAKARILILDHPTRGLDVGAKEEVYDLIRAVTAEGIAVILTSDTLEETIGLSHSILVMRDGLVTHRVSAQSGHKPKQIELIGHMV
jgi:ribose transport system ATP-binding protein